jgi:NADH:ubiquinone oxidoreductase subunit 4 (subunit M)
VFSGKLPDHWKKMRDLTVAEQCVLAPAIFLMFVAGLYPQLISGMVHGTVMQLVGLVRY